MRIAFGLAWCLIVISCANHERFTENSKDLYLNARGSEGRNDNWLSLQQRFYKERIAGADFIAFGKDPDWQVLITKDSNLSLNLKIESVSFEAQNVQSVESQDLNPLRYVAHIEEGEIHVLVFSDSCMSENEGLLPNRVKVFLQENSGAFKEFTGCGLYLNDPSLHDIWALKRWSHLSHEHKIPSGAYLEFNLQSNLIYANIGCGEITGGLLPRGSKMKISGLHYVDKKCSDEGISMKLFNQLNFKTHEVLKNGMELQLMSDNDTLTFLKAD